MFYKFPQPQYLKLENTIYRANTEIPYNIMQIMYVKGELIHSRKDNPWLTVSF